MFTGNPLCYEKLNDGSTVSEVVYGKCREVTSGRFVTVQKTDGMNLEFEELDFIMARPVEGSLEYLIYSIIYMMDIYIFSI